MTAGDSAPRVAVVVATLGHSSLLRSALAAIDRQRQQISLELLVVAQGKSSEEAARAIDEFADEHIKKPDPLGFAAANNTAIAPLIETGSHPDYIALVNDDAILADGWLSALIAHLDADPQLASAQGLNLLGRDQDEADRVDGAGIAWNRRWQAIQIGHGEPASAFSDATEVLDRFGASATAAVYRTKALVQVAQSRPSSRSFERISAVFDERLTTYYEDVELACRLQQLGWRAAFVPAARCLHAGSDSAPPDRRSLLVANRHLVLARYLGRSYLLRIPQLLLRDLVEFGPSAVGGWTRAGRLLPNFFRFNRAQSLALHQT